MLYRNHKGLSISEIGLGCYALSGVYGKKDPGEYCQVIKMAYEAGVNFFDTAQAYGEGERILGESVKPFRNEVLIATKVGVKEGLKPNLSASYIQSSCEQSLRTLQTNVIDLYQIHFDDPTIPVEEVVQILENLVSQGKIRYYGLGHLPAKKVQSYLKTGKIFSILMELHAAERTAQKEMLPVCRQQEVAAIAFSVTGRGILTGRFNSETEFTRGDIRTIDPLFQRERFQSGLRIAVELDRIGKKYGKTSTQAAIAWVLSQPGVVCALTGPSRLIHLEENLGGSGWSFSEEDQIEFDRFLVKEGEWLAKEQLTSLELILVAPLPEETHQAFNDLVYASETAINLGIVEEENILPLFMKLFGLRKQLSDPTSLFHLQQVQKDLKETISGTVS